ncbi:MAG TPA: EI24 domain-containing protein [Candidatus Obscuribacterales bacterium]
MSASEPSKKKEALPTSGIGGLVAGFSYPLRAIAFLQQTPRLAWYVLIPIIINVIVGGTFYTWALSAGFNGIDGLMAGLPDWARFLELLLRGLLAIILLIATGLLLLQFGGILGSPLYGRLSEELEILRTGHKPEDVPGIGSIVRDIWRAILFELKKLVLVIGLGLPLFFIGWFPGIGTAIATVGSIGLGVTIVCLDFFDPALERRRLRFRDKLGWVRRSFPASATFGLVSLGLVSIPFVNLLAIPLCITAGTLFFCDRILPKLEPGNRD